MEAVAILRNAPFSPRKMRLVADLVRGKNVHNAINILKFEGKLGARFLEKLLLSASANWEAKNPQLSGHLGNLRIKTIFVDGGRMMKRVQPAPQGRAYRVRKRSNHITVVVDIPENLYNSDMENVANEILSSQTEGDSALTSTDNQE
jgi:large subunit ribosomal protein L22